MPEFTRATIKYRKKTSKVKVGTFGTQKLKHTH